MFWILLIGFLVLAAVGNLAAWIGAATVAALILFLMVKYSYRETRVFKKFGPKGSK